MTGQKTKGLRSVDGVRKAIRTGHAKRLWEAVRIRARAAATFIVAMPQPPAQEKSQDFALACRAEKVNV